MTNVCTKISFRGLFKDWVLSVSRSELLNYKLGSEARNVLSLFGWIVSVGHLCPVVRAATGAIPWTLLRVSVDWTVQTPARVYATSRILWTCVTMRWCIRIAAIEADLYLFLHVSVWINDQLTTCFWTWCKKYCRRDCLNGAAFFSYEFLSYAKSASPEVWSERSEFWLLT